MAFRWIEVLCPPARVDAVRRAAEEARASEIVVTREGAGDRAAVRILAGEIDRQALLDRLQGILEHEETWRIVLVAADAVIPHTEAEDEAEREREAERARIDIRATREEVYQTVSRGAALDRDFVLLVVLSTVVAGIGLVTDNVAVVIGAMVIAPLLGPNLALAFAVAVGDRGLALKALLTVATGIALAVGLALLVPVFGEVDVRSGEVGARTEVGYASVALALASGAAAALSITTGVSATLVGVMVAVALLPPAATVGICLAEAEWTAAAGATLLLGVNIVSVNIATLGVFLAKGVRPRTWYDREGARQSVRLTAIGLGVALAVMLALIAVSHRTGL